MSPITNAVLGIAFLVIGVAATLLMFHLWGYPYDKEKLKSSAPTIWLFVHRAMGWVFVGIYIYLMAQMVPRMWNYQIEFPARTVMHLTLGMAIGALLLVKIVIVRFFHHLEGQLAPFLGTSLLICTVLLIGLSAPFAFREGYLQASAMDAFDDQSLERVRQHLDGAGLDDQERREFFGSVAGLEAGRDVLFGPCIQCHDLRTVLARPRTPQNWHATVVRMADRAKLVEPISEDEQWAVAAYLIAISPDLQRSAAERRDADAEETAAGEAALSLNEPEAGESTYDPAQAKVLAETQCNLCHPSALVEASPPASPDAARELVQRMVTNGMSATPAELQQIVRYLSETYAP